MKVKYELLIPEVQPVNFKSEVDDLVSQAKDMYQRVRSKQGKAKLITEIGFNNWSIKNSVDRSATKNQLVARLAIVNLLDEWNVLDDYYSGEPYSPFPINEDELAESDKKIWSVELPAPDNDMRLNYKYAPGVEDQGWEFALLAIHKDSPNQWILPPEETLNIWQLNQS